MICRTFTKMMFCLAFMLTLALATLNASGQNVSDEARRHFDSGMAAVESARGARDLELAINEFKQATVLAPAWPDAHFNLGKVLDAAERYEDAVAAFNAYLRAAPGAADADAVRALIKQIESKRVGAVTAETAVEILAQLAAWRPQPVESQSLTYLRRKDANTIEVPNSMIWGPNSTRPDVFYKDVKVTGRRVIFWYIKTLIDKNSVANYSVDVVVEIEVTSRTKVKVLENQIWRYWSTGGDPVRRTFAYELTP